MERPSNSLVPQYQNLVRDLCLLLPRFASFDADDQADVLLRVDALLATRQGLSESDLGVAELDAVLFARAKEFQAVYGVDVTAVLPKSGTFHQKVIRLAKERFSQAVSKMVGTIGSGSITRSATVVTARQRGGVLVFTVELAQPLETDLVKPGSGHQALHQVETFNSQCEGIQLCQ